MSAGESVHQALTAGGGTHTTPNHCFPLLNFLHTSPLWAWAGLTFPIRRICSEKEGGKGKYPQRGAWGRVSTRSVGFLAFFLTVGLIPWIFTLLAFLPSAGGRLAQACFIMEQDKISRDQNEGVL